jgi:subtilisin family serine protease
VQTDLAVYLISQGTAIPAQVNVADNRATDSPWERLQFDNNLTTTEFEIVVEVVHGPAPGRVKWVNYGDVFDSFGNRIAFDYVSASSSTVVPHAAARGARAIGAVDYALSSVGSNTILFGIDGNRLAVPELRNAPQLAAVTGVDTTFFGTDTDGNGYPNFFGTSAAAPHAAAIAALVWQANPGFTPAQLYSRLELTAAPMPGQEAIAAFGRIDALRAVGYSGGEGDVVAIDFKKDRGGTTFELVDLPNWTANARLFASSFETSGQLSIVPNPGFTGAIHGRVRINGQEQLVIVNIRPGYSTHGDNAVRVGNSDLDLLRLQQRLRYFGYRGADGQPLESSILPIRRNGSSCRSPRSTR